MNFENPESVDERIEAATIRFRDQLFNGPSHAFAIIELDKVFPDWLGTDEKVEDGFVTNTGRFVERDEAGEIARKAGQLDHLDEEKMKTAAGRLDSDFLRKSN